MGLTCDIGSLVAGACAVVAATDPAQKAGLARRIGVLWRERRLSHRNLSTDPRPAQRPGRPARPELLPPGKMPRRSMAKASGRQALLHALAHIELNAIDLAWDLIARFPDCNMPRSYFDDWVRVGVEEAGHFQMIENRLHDLGSHYGALPAHDGLWQAAQATGHSLIARLAVIPLVLEARGLDVTPSMIRSAQSQGDEATANILRVIYRDEKGHVAVGMRWFRYQCDRLRIDPQAEFQHLVRRHFRSQLKPPFNDRARAEAGLTPGFYRPLTRFSPA
jgi:uncharacterized ferritin-like protein (DUF455 family)